MTGDDLALFVDDDRDFEAKFLDRCSHGVNTGRIVPGVIRVGLDVGDVLVDNL